MTTVIHIATWKM